MFIERLTYRFGYLVPTALGTRDQSPGFIPVWLIINLKMMASLAFLGTPSSSSFSIHCAVGGGMCQNLCVRSIPLGSAVFNWQIYCPMRKLAAGFRWLPNRHWISVEFDRCSCLVDMKTQQRKRRKEHPSSIEIDLPFGVTMANSNKFQQLIGTNSIETPAHYVINEWKPTLCNDNYPLWFD